MYSYYRDHDEPMFTEVFVFGSNEIGRHGRGAALHARQFHGAKIGIGEGPTGTAYALPTKDGNIQTLPLAVIKSKIETFKRYALSHQNNAGFFVTPIGTGLAGYSHAQIAPLFKGSPTNCRFHINWKQYLE